jgi:hypothetical protein
VLGGVDVLELEVVLEHLVDQVVKRRLGLPAQALGGLRSVAAQLVHL